jgi:hypothetical protein
MWLQSQCNGKTVRDFTLAAILMDLEEILRQDESRICNAVTISKQDKSLGAFRMMEERAKKAGRRHRRLVVDRTSTDDETRLRERPSFCPREEKQLSDATESQNTLLQTSSWSIQDMRPLLTGEKPVVLGPSKLR